MNNTAFLSFLFTYQGELSGFMPNCTDFFVKFDKHWVKVPNNCWFRDLRAIAPKAFLFFLFTYRGELGSFMQNSQVFFGRVLQTLSESTEQRVFSGFKGDRCYARVVRNRVFRRILRYKPKKSQKPGFFGFDAS